MKFKTFFLSIPRNQRARLCTSIAQAHGVAEVTVRSWINGLRNHPCRLQAIQLTEQLTDGKVTRHDLRPEVFGPTPSHKQAS